MNNPQLVIGGAEMSDNEILEAAAIDACIKDNIADLFRDVFNIYGVKICSVEAAWMNVPNNCQPMIKISELCAVSDKVQPRPQPAPIR